MAKELASIATFLYRHEAELAKSLLSEKGIEAIISADDLGGYRPDLSMGNVKLLVKKEDVEKAKEVLKVLEKPIEE